MSSLPSISYGFAKRFGVLVDAEADGGVRVCHRPGLDPDVIIELRRTLGRPFELEVLDEETFDARLAADYEQQSGQAMDAMGELGEDADLDHLAAGLPEPEDLLEADDDAPIIRLLNALLTQAVKEGASDIHVEPFERRMVVRFRVDGVLQEVLEPPRQIAPLLVSRIKVMAQLDIAEKRLPQDGRISLKIAGRPIDVRVSTLPGSQGERVVLRLLDKQAGRLDLSHLGMQDHTRRTMESLVNRPHGIILVTGPTGSGKTTTLYAALSQINDRSRNILTVEDPVEYELDGIGQTQVNSKVDMSFARGLRAILRQDPDVVMVGEIRDLETAEIAVQASLTGHLVLSTLHTNTAIGAITRLRDMGVEPFLLSSSLIGVLAQRLVRRVEPGCCVRRAPTEQERRILGERAGPDTQLLEPVEEGDCAGHGYAGRTGIYELITVDANLQRMIHDGTHEQAMTEYVRAHTPSMRDDGIARVLDGQTTLQEVMRVTSEED